MTISGELSKRELLSITNDPINTFITVNSFTAEEVKSELTWWLTLIYFHRLEVSRPEQHRHRRPLLYLGIERKNGDYFNTKAFGSNRRRWRSNWSVGESSGITENHRIGSGTLIICSSLRYRWNQSPFNLRSRDVVRCRTSSWNASPGSEQTKFLLVKGRANRWTKRGFFSIMELSVGESNWITAFR